MMTPSQASDEKIQRILSAVRTVLTKNGYAATTISQVAAEAGVSRGLLHYYFKNKEEMLARVVRENVEFSVKMAQSIFRESSSTNDLASRLTVALRRLFEADPDFYHLFFESWAIARQSPLIDRELRRLYREFREAIRQGLQEAVSLNIIAPKIPLNGLAALLTSIFDGMGLQLMTEPELAADEMIWSAMESGLRFSLGGA
jgi:AcrR family transcriptional regulator